LLSRRVRRAADAEKEPLFVSNRGARLDRDAAQRIVRKPCPDAVLHNGVDRTVIALWLGHESIDNTQMYVHVDIELKEKAMAKTQPTVLSPGRDRQATICRLPGRALIMPASLARAT
jgi:integrase/recombinase XerD